MTRRIAMGLVALALALPLPALAQAGDLRAQIAKMDQAWQTAYNAGDAAAVSALYAPDAKVMAPGAEPASGAAAIQAFFAADIAKGAKNTLTTGESRSVTVTSPSRLAAGWPTSPTASIWTTVRT